MEWVKLAQSQIKDVLEFATYDWEVILICTDALNLPINERFYFNAQEFFTYSDLNSCSFAEDSFVEEVRKLRN